MNENEYVIISKTAILKRIQELEKISRKELWNYMERETLQDILSQSTPLITEIEKLIVMASASDIDFLPDRVEKIKQGYISNLKLDI